MDYSSRAAITAERARTSLNLPQSSKESGTCLYSDIGHFFWLSPQALQLDLKHWGHPGQSTSSSLSLYMLQILGWVDKQNGPIFLRWWYKLGLIWFCKWMSSCHWEQHKLLTAEHHSQSEGHSGTQSHYTIYVCVCMHAWMHACVCVCPSREQGRVSLLSSGFNFM